MPAERADGRGLSRRGWFAVVAGMTILAGSLVADTNRLRPALETPAADLAVAQWPLIAGAARIEAAAATAQRPGFAGLELAVPVKEIRLYWKGDPPAGVAGEIARLRSEAGLRISIRSAPHTTDELRAAADAVKRSGAAGLVSIAIPVSGSGLEVGVAPGQGAGQLPSRIGDVPVRVHAEKPQKPYGHDDAEPLSAGASISAFNGAGCGSSFSAWTWERIGSDLKRRHYTLAAAHCGGEVGFNYWSGQGLPIGQAELIRPDIDSIAVHTNIWTLPRIYSSGTVTDLSLMPVRAQGVNRVGTFLCQSGVAGGVRCGLKVVSTGKSVYNQDHWVNELVVAEQVDGTVAAVEGDSGSPVFGLAEPSGVNAMGSLYGPEKPLDSCPGGFKRCASSIQFVDLKAILEKHKLQLAIAGDPLAWPPAVSLATHRDRPQGYVRHLNTLGAVTAINNDADRQDASFWNLSGLDLPGTGRSFQPVNLPGRFLHQDSGRIKVSPEQGNLEYRKDATFTLVKGLGDSAGTSYESARMPGFHLHQSFWYVGRGPLGPIWKSYLSIESRDPPEDKARQCQERGVPAGCWQRDATFYPVPALWNPADH